MSKSTHFLGQPVYGQVINLLDKSKILQISRENGGEHYVKSFDAWSHMTTMLYGVIQRFDSLREIEISLQAEARKLLHVGLSKPPSRSTISDANAIKIQIWVTLIANLLLMVLKSRIRRSWSFSGFATALRIVLMYYIDLYRFFESPDADWQQIEQGRASAPPERPSLFD
jgi:hypothetical protein